MLSYFLIQVELEKLLDAAHSELAKLKAQRGGENPKTPGDNKRTLPNAAGEPPSNPPPKKLKNSETPSSSATQARGPVQPQARHSGAHFISLSLE